MKAPDKDIFKAWYRRWFQNLDEQPPAEAWDYISESLDLDEVWDGVSKVLDADADLTAASSASSSFIKNGWLILLFLCMVPALPLSDYIISDSALENETSSIIRDAYKAEELPPYARQEIANEKTRKTVYPALKEDDFNMSDLHSIPDQPTATFYKVNDIGIINAVKAGLATQTTGCNPMKSDIEARSYNRSLFEIDQIERNTEKQWYLGMIGARNNTWLLNYQTRQGLRTTHLNQTVMTYNNEFGLSGGFIVKKGLALQADWYINSQLGQSYQEYINALRVNRDVKLDYSKFQLSVIKDLSKKTRGPVPFFTGGIYAGFLKEATESINGVGSDITREYATVDLGVMVGAGIKYPLTERIKLQPSIRSSYSLRNTYRGNDFIPGAFLPSRNAQIGLNVGIYYIF
jgi:hypothetical protein